MKRILCCIAAVLVSLLTFAQDADSPGWAPEFSVKAFVSVYHGSYELTAGARYGDNVFGLSSGYGTEYWDAYPAQVRKIPAFGFYRFYIPLSEKRRFLLFGDISLGGEYVYRISGNFRDRGEEMKVPYWKWRTCITPGIALRLFGRTNLYIAPTMEVLSLMNFNWGATAG